MSAVARYLESWLKPVQVTVSLWPVGGGGEREYIMVSKGVQQIHGKIPTVRVKYFG